MIKADKDTEAGVLPDEKLLTDMLKYNEELVNAGVMLAGEGLHPSAKGKRVRFSGGKQTVIDGPFAETKELIAGFWLWQVKSKEEAIEWVKRCPPGRRDRGPAGVRGRRLRGRAHSRAPGTGGAPAPAGGGEAVVNRTLWIVQWLLAAPLTWMGGLKLVLPIEQMTAQMDFRSLLRFLGVAEVLGALGLCPAGAAAHPPGLTPLAAVGLVVTIMIRARSSPGR
jgi:hypothetical protein